jgi:hypothetical protein
MSITPSALLDAIGARIGDLAPDKNNALDLFRRVKQTEDMVGRDRQFKIQLDRGPGEDSDRLVSNWRRLEFSLIVSYMSTPEIVDRIAADNVLVDDELSAMHGWETNVVHVDRLDLPRVDHFDGFKLVTHEWSVTYIQT